MASQQGDDDDEVFDDEVLETLKLIKERATNANDIIEYCLVKVGEPGDKCLSFDIVVTVEKKT
jgi:hypothetical protein